MILSLHFWRLPTRKGYCLIDYKWRSDLNHLLKTLNCEFMKLSFVKKSSDSSNSSSFITTTTNKAKTKSLLTRSRERVNPAVLSRNNQDIKDGDGTEMIVTPVNRNFTLALLLLTNCFRELF